MIIFCVKFLIHLVSSCVISEPLPIYLCSPEEPSGLGEQ